MMKSAHNSSLSAPEAEKIALRLLTFMAGEPDHMSRFMALTGMGPDELRANAGSSHFQVAMLDHLLEDETLLLTFCTNQNISPELIAPARHVLSGDEANLVAYYQFDNAGIVLNETNNTVSENG
jgi:hypothetical protein